MTARTAAIQAAIAELDGELHVLGTRRRELLYAAGTPGRGLVGVDELAGVSTKMTALTQRKNGLAELLAEAAAQDDAERRKQDEAEIFGHMAAASQALQKRVDIGAQIDEHVAALGELLREVQATNEAAADAINAAIRKAHLGREQAVNLRITIGDYLTGRAVGGALASKLRAHGIGEIGIPVQVIWNYATMGEAESVRETLEFAKQKIEVGVGWTIGAVVESIEQPAPLPSKLTDQERRQMRTYADISPEEHKAAAQAAAGQPREMTLDDFDLTDEEREGLRGHFDANGAGRRGAVINGQKVQVAGKPKGKA